MGLESAAGGRAAARLMSWLRRRFPPRSGPPEVLATDADLRREFHRWWLAEQFAFMAAMPAAWYLLYRAVPVVERMTRPEAHQALAVLRPHLSAWALPGVFLGIALAGAVVTAAWRLLLRGRWEDFTAYAALAGGVDSAVLERLNLLLMVGLFTATLPALAAVASWSVVFERDRIRTASILGTRDYSYREVVSVDRLARPRGAPVFRVRLKDGKAITIGDLLEPRGAVGEALARGVARRAGLGAPRRAPSARDPGTRRASPPGF